MDSVARLNGVDSVDGMDGMDGMTMDGMGRIASIAWNDGAWLMINPALSTPYSRTSVDTHKFSLVT